MYVREVCLPKDNNLSCTRALFEFHNSQKLLLKIQFSSDKNQGLLMGGEIVGNPIYKVSKIDVALLYKTQSREEGKEDVKKFEWNIPILLSPLSHQPSANQGE
jgi:hypothetical protein